MPMPGSCHCSGRSTQQTCTRHPPRAQWSQCHSSRKKLSWVCFSDLNVLWDISWDITYQHFHFVEILGLAIAVLDLLGEDQVKLKQEHSTFPRLTYQLLRVPHMESILKIESVIINCFFPIPVPEGWHRQDDRWWDHNHQGEKGGGRRWPSSARRGTRPSLPWSPPPSVRALGTCKL